MSLIRLPGDQLHSPSLIGISRWGLALKAFSCYSKSKVALKLLWSVSAIDDLLEVLKEVILMTSLQHLCLISLKRVICLGPQTYALITDLMDMSLKDLVLSRKSYSTEHIQLIIYQVILALRHVNAAGVAHTGVGLGTVLLSTTCDVKLWGFQGCTQHGDPLRPCKWVVRALSPEQGLCPTASEKLDVYQTGLLFLSLLFHQDMAQETSRPSMSSFSLSEQDLATQLLAPDPSTRITFQQALSHPYFNDLDLEPEQDFPPPVSIHRLEQLNKEELERELSLALSN